MKLLSAVLLLSLCSFAWSQDVWSQPSFSVEAPRLLQASLAIPVKEGPETIVLRDSRTFSFDQQGRCTTTTHRVYRILTATGVDNWGSLQSRWEPWHESKPRLRARVITSNGAVHELDQNTIAEAPVDETSDIYTDSKIIRAPLPALAVGSVVETEVTITETAPVPGKGSLYRSFLGFYVPAHATTVIVEAPAEMSIRHSAKMLPGLVTSRVEENGRQKLTFSHGPMDALEDAESYLPSDTPRWPMFTIATGISWTQVARDFNQAVDAQIRVADVERLMPKTAATSSDRLATANALLARMRPEIRYTGVELGDASYIPRTPAETLKRGYGDCKDQAAVLVAMLRRAGMPAHLALLNTGPGEDVSPDLPGMGVFDHAIVYVPGSPELWADPTDPFARFNELPASDGDRYALIIAENGRLHKTPEPRPQDNRSIETRVFRLPEDGKATVEETTEVWGDFERNYRDYYRGLEPKKVKEQLDEYAKTHYNGTSIENYNITDPADVATPFRLTLQVKDAGRGIVANGEAAVGIPISSLLDKLPEELRSESEDAKPRKGDFVFFQPFIAEWRYRIVPPLGFTPSPLPESGKDKLGPAMLTKEYLSEPDGTVLATFRFDVGKRVYTAAEATALKTAALSLQKAPMPLVRFEQTAAALLSSGKIREGLQELRRLSAAHPNEALHHIQLANALLKAGVGESARAAALKATELEPKSELAFRVLGSVLEHDLVGRRFGKGADLVAAGKAYRKATELNPTDYDSRVSLAILLEHAPNGERYASKQKIDEAIVEYRAMEGKLNSTFENNILFAMLRAGRFAELLELAKTRKQDATTNTMIVAATAGLAGAAKALEEARRITTDDQARRAAITGAGQQLLFARMYEASATLLEAGAAGTERAAQMQAAAAGFRKAKKYDEVIAATKGPSAVLLRVLSLLMQPTSSDEELRSLFMAKSSLRRPDAPKGMRAGIAPMLRQASKAGLPTDVVLDLSFAATRTEVEGDDQGGYRVKSETSSPTGVHRFSAFIVREDNQYRLVGLDEITELGSVILQFVDKGELDHAKRWLDWAREKEPLTGGDDTLAGPAFPRMWKRGSDADVDRMRVAAASLMARTLKDGPQAIPILEAAKAKAAPQDQLPLNLALVSAYTTLRKTEAGLALIQELFREYPESDSAFAHLVGDLNTLGRTAEVDKLISERLSRHPNDTATMSVAAHIAMYQQKYDVAIALGKKIAASSQSSEGDLNNLAWTYALADKVTDEALEFGQKAAAAGKNQAYPSLHTLATLYAEAGKTAEARTLMLQAMDVAGQDDPGSEGWFVFGRIFEHYGMRDSALGSYARIEKPAQPETAHMTSWGLAQRRMRALSQK